MFAQTFAQEGTWLLAGGGSLGFSQVKPSFGDTQNAFALELSPQVLYFVKNRWALGGDAILGYTTAIDETIGGRTHWYSAGIAPKGGYAFLLSERVTFLPQLQLRYTYHRLNLSDYASTAARSTANTQHIFALGFLTTFLFHITEHAFIGLSPEVRVDLLAKKSRGMGEFTEDSKLWELRLQALIGFWL